MALEWVSEAGDVVIPVAASEAGIVHRLTQRVWFSTFSTEKQVRLLGLLDRYETDLRVIANSPHGEQLADELLETAEVDSYASHR